MVLQHGHDLPRSGEATRGLRVSNQANAMVRWDGNRAKSRDVSGCRRALFRGVFLTPSYVEESFTAAIVVRSPSVALRCCCVTDCWASRWRPRVEVMGAMAVAVGIAFL